MILGKVIIYIVPPAIRWKDSDEVTSPPEFHVLRKKLFLNFSMLLYLYKNKKYSIDKTIRNIRMNLIPINCNVLIC